MKNKLRMGFEYDITHIAPTGEILEKQKVHNILINEGISNFLKCVFIKNANTYSSDWESRYSAFTYAFMESEYEPQPTDSLNGNNALDLYGVDYNNTLLSQGKDYNHYTLMTSDIKIGKDQISIIIGEGYYKFTGYKTLTGVCLFRNNFNNKTGIEHQTFVISSLYSLIKSCVLISAAKFKTPIQVNPGGTIRAKSNFIILPA